VAAYVVPFPRARENHDREEKEIGWASFLKFVKSKMPNCWREPLFELPILVHELPKHKICQLIFREVLKML
jgi:hypothetical protein